mmetsp:Transcript_34695/g.74938  ORF Transcript_34695/g.74938 Transcript_34695/m.74938 type:complete len:223 (-) Transcript_34695:67-735(-)
MRSAQSSSGPGDLVLLLAQDLGGGRAEASEGEVVVEEADEDEGDGALGQAVDDLEEPDGVEGEPDGGAGDEEDRLQNLSEDEEDQQRPEALEQASHDTNEDGLVVQEHERDTDLEDHGVLADGVNDGLGRSGGSGSRLSHDRLRSGNLGNLGCRGLGDGGKVPRPSGVLREDAHGPQECGASSLLLHLGRLTSDSRGSSPSGHSGKRASCSSEHGFKQANIG